MKSNMKVHVVFHHSDDKLCNMFCETYSSVALAKAAIETDADCFIYGHRYLIGKKYRQKRGWVNPYTEDYYMAQGQDGTKCYWQYFVEQ